MIASFLMIIFYHSIYIEVVKNTFSTWHVWADKCQPRLEFLQPRDVIRATHSVAHNRIIQKLPSPHVQIFDEVSDEAPTAYAFAC